MPLPESDDQVLLLHNPRCSKSRATLLLLEERGIAFEERRYLEDPLSRSELDELRVRLDKKAVDWVRRGEAAYADAALDGGSDDSAVLDAIAESPILMERPIVIRGARAIVGRPPQVALELFD